MGKGNFISQIIKSVFSSSDPEASKRKALKNIAKNLQKGKYHYFKYSSHEVEPAVAKFFYEVYKNISPAQTVFQSIQKPQLKRMVINNALSEKQLAALEELQEASIIEDARKLSLKQVSQKVKDNIGVVMSEFNGENITKTDGLYTKLMAFANFALFDYYFVLKKFDSSIKEHVFDGNVKFSSINGTYIVEDLKNFMDVAFALPLDCPWDDVFKLIKSVKGVDAISMGAWKKMISKIRNLRDHRALEMLVQLISEDPTYHDNTRVKELAIVDDFLSETKNTAASALESIRARQTAGKVEGLLNQVFGTTDIDHLKYYNEAGSSPFERKEIGSFAYQEPLSYLRAFILDYVKKDIKELSDILLVRGEWASQSLATPMSEAYNNIVGLVEQISTLDNSVCESSDLGLKMKTLLPRTERDKEARNIISSTLDYINDSAGKIILDAIKHFVIYDKNLKMVLEDCVKKNPELVVNWKDLDHFAEGQLRQMCIDSYKKIFAFVSLMQSFHVELVQKE